MELMVLLLCKSLLKDLCHKAGVLFHELFEVISVLDEGAYLALFDL